MIDHNAQRQGGDGLGFEQEEGAREEDADGQEGRRQGQQELLTDGGRRESVGPVSWEAQRGRASHRKGFFTNENGKDCLVCLWGANGDWVVPVVVKISFCKADPKFLPRLLLRMQKAFEHGR